MAPTCSEFVFSLAGARSEDSGQIICSLADGSEESVQITVSGEYPLFQRDISVVGSARKNVLKSFYTLRQDAASNF